MSPTKPQSWKPISGYVPRQATGPKGVPGVRWGRYRAIGIAGGVLFDLALKVPLGSVWCGRGKAG